MLFHNSIRPWGCSLSSLERKQEGKRQHELFVGPCHPPLVAAVLTEWEAEHEVIRGLGRRELNASTHSTAVCGSAVCVKGRGKTQLEWGRGINTKN